MMFLLSPNLTTTLRFYTSLMNDIRRTLLSVIFAFSLIMLWDNWQVHNGKSATFFPKPTEATTQADTANNTTQAANGESLPQARMQNSVNGAEGNTTTNGNTTSVTTGGEQLPQNANAETIIVRNADVELEFSNMGGSLKKATLLHQADYGHKADSPDRLVLMNESPTRIYRADSGLVGAQGSDLPSHLSTRPMQVNRTQNANGDTVLQFTGTSDSGVTLIKTYTIAPEGYTLNVRHELQGATEAAQDVQLYMQLVRDGNDAPGSSFFYRTFTGPAVYSEEEHYEKVDFDDIADKSASYQRSTSKGFISMVEHYFASAWLLPDGTQREHYAEQVGSNLYSVGMLTGIEPNKPVEARLFVGPQEEKRLEKIYLGLASVKDYGIFTIIAKPMFWLVDFLHNIIGNWGWTIIALVVLLKIAFFWLNAKAYSSMAKMKKLGPRMTAMRERFKDDPRQMQTEMMKLYKEEKVNPMGGCLPILVQIPVFISLYWVILSTVEFRNAPWIGWIQDLSSPDPYYILPLLMAATSVLQVWLNPKPADEMQAKMMWIMPIAFSIMFFFFPSGLVLYWLTNNILSIAQQWLINKKLGVLNNN